VQQNKQESMSSVAFMSFYFILAVRTCATKYSATTLQRKYVDRDYHGLHGSTSCCISHWPK